MSDKLTDYERFKRDHPGMLKLAEEHMVETEELAGQISDLQRDNARLKEEIEKMRAVLYRKGYRECCSIPACNCGNQWAHGGHAETRLSEIYDTLGELTQGATALQAITYLKTENEKMRAIVRSIKAQAKVLVDTLDAFDGVGIPQTDAAGAFGFLRELATLDALDKETKE